MVTYIPLTFRPGVFIPMADPWRKKIAPLGSLLIEGEATPA